MEKLMIEAWHKPDPHSQSEPAGIVEFQVDQASHLALERAEEQLLESNQSEIMVDADLSTLELEASTEMGHLIDCQYRVYRDNTLDRGHFHLVAKREEDNSLVYTNAVMVDQLG